METYLIVVIIIVLLILLFTYVKVFKNSNEGMLSDEEAAKLIRNNTFTSNKNGKKEGYTTAGAQFPNKIPTTELNWMDTVEEMQLDPQVIENHKEWSKDIAEKYYTGAVFNKITGDMTVNQANFQGFGGIRHKLGLSTIGQSARQVPTDEEPDMLNSTNNYLQWSPTAADSEYFGNRKRSQGFSNPSTGSLPDRGEAIATDFAQAERGYGYLNANF